MRSSPAFPSGSDFYGESNSEHGRRGMSLRQYAAIKLKVPDSGLEWLDEMIAKSLRNDLAAKALQGFCSNPNAGRNPIESANWLRESGAVSAYQMAEAMLEVSSKS